MKIPALYRLDVFVFISFWNISLFKVSNLSKLHLTSILQQESWSNPVTKSDEQIVDFHFQKPWLYDKSVINVSNKPLVNLSDILLFWCLLWPLLQPACKTGQEKDVIFIPHAPNFLPNFWTRDWWKTKANVKWCNNWLFHDKQWTYIFCFCMDFRILFLSCFHTVYWHLDSRYFSEVVLAYYKINTIKKKLFISVINRRVC